ncbi:MAG: uracil-DNA glycosylase [Gammaproteobacteria bacterium]
MSSPKSSGINNEQNAQYLQAMGVQSWALRAQPLTSVVENLVEEVDEETVKDVIVKPVNDVTTENAPAETAAVIADAVERGVATTTTDVDVMADVSQLDWSALQSMVSSCTACGLHESRTNTVFGVGDHQAQVMVIGEAPGADEDHQGEPFVGPDGQLLNNMLLAIGFKREQVYIVNILKCRPPGDRDPQPEEVSQCESYLQRQIEMVKPKVILAVGRIAAHNLMKVDTPIGEMRGKQYQYAGTPVVVTYHPTYLLHKPSEKAKSWDDLRLALSIIHAGDENKTGQVTL